MKTALFAFTLLACASAHAGSIGAAIKDLDDGTRASVVKELSKMHRYQDDKDGKNPAGTRGQSSDSCDMNVNSSNNDARPGMRTPRKPITVVTGNIVQICNR
ncbi:hypothetical protein [Dokdonella sp.]|uniref:hypothetical protein n=1 Tax=Dokdonella sp. TaxID=2291710 RepID=UPI0025C0977A|nr:hypothetical protein [Dokdonella sp.]MBX3689285.1 hypothetical protein [Dokdonella sp.]